MASTIFSNGGGINKKLFVTDNSDFLSRTVYTRNTGTSDFLYPTYSSVKTGNFTYSGTTLTCNVAGKYNAIGRCATYHWGNIYIGATIRVNGVVLILSGTTMSAGGSLNNVLPCAYGQGIIELSVGDKIELTATMGYNTNMSGTGIAEIYLTKID